MSRAYRRHELPSHSPVWYARVPAPSGPVSRLSGDHGQHPGGSARVGAERALPADRECSAPSRTGSTSATPASARSSGRWPRCPPPARASRAGHTRGWECASDKDGCALCTRDWQTTPAWGGERNVRARPPARPGLVAACGGVVVAYGPRGRRLGLGSLPDAPQRPAGRGRIGVVAGLGTYLGEFVAGERSFDYEPTRCAG
jgi:hypothetical protein